MDDAKMQEAINEMAKHALRLYNLMTPGMTLHVAITEHQAIITPGKPAQKKLLIVTKPSILVGLDLAPNDAEKN